MVLLTALALEVMDKEPSARVLWTFGVAIGLLGYLAARWRRRTAWLAIGIACLLALGLLTELLDPAIWPAILQETKGRYPWHLAGSLGSAVAFTLLGARRSMRGAV